MVPKNIFHFVFEGGENCYGDGYLEDDIPELWTSKLKRKKKRFHIVFQVRKFEKKKDKSTVRIFWIENPRLSKCFFL